MEQETFDLVWGAYNAELQRDQIGIWMLVRRVEHLRPELPPEQVRATVIAVIEHALAAGRATAFRNGEPWNDPPAQIAWAIAQEWAALRRNPNPGEILWLRRPGGYPPLSAERRADFAATKRRLKRRLGRR